MPSTTELIPGTIAVRPIKTEADFNQVVNRLRYLATLLLDDGSPEDDEFEILQTLADAYQKKHLLIPPPHPLDAIKIRFRE
jgi:HTH-type transcriptional regulator / antitoxin HigA